jgi:DNA-binding PadR family transcriptional regulator
LSKKIIFVGPPEAGKTTLRKIFFEGENRKELLDVGLEPTHGQEATLLKLSETVGVFDLAGQENQRWLESDEKTVFYDTQIILVVIDITTPLSDILDFIKQIIQIREEITPSSYIYILLHKKDLITRDRLSDVKVQLIENLGYFNQLKIAFTSIKKKFFLETLNLFMDILRTCTSKIIREEKLNLELLRNAVDLLYTINQQIVISKIDINSKTPLDPEIIQQILELLESKKYVNVTLSHDIPLYSLTEKGKITFAKILKDFTETGKILETYLVEKFDDFKPSPPILGFMIADKDGKTLMISEVHEGVFKNFLTTDEQNTQTDPELIPMFISALEKFSTEIHINNLSGFSLQGTNIKMETIRFELLTVTYFMSGTTNINPLKDEVYDWFNQLITENEKDFEKAIILGDVSDLVELSKKGQEWLNELNQKYKKLAINLDIFDFKQATDLYEKLDKIFQKIQVDYSVQIQKIKKLKKNLMKAVYEENFEEIRDIARITNDLRMN